MFALHHMNDDGYLAGNDTEEVDSVRNVRKTVWIYTKHFLQVDQLTLSPTEFCYLSFGKHRLSHRDVLGLR